MAIVTLGIDLAKNVFALHGVNEAGKPVLLKPQVPRAKLLELIAALPPCTIGLEACGGAHHWARQFQRYGHTVRLIAPKFVAPGLGLSARTLEKALLNPEEDVISIYACLLKLHYSNGRASAADSTVCEVRFELHLGEAIDERLLLSASVGTEYVACFAGSVMRAASAIAQGEPRPTTEALRRRARIGARGNELL